MGQSSHLRIREFVGHSLEKRLDGQIKPNLDKQAFVVHDANCCPHKLWEMLTSSFAVHPLKQRITS